MVLMMVLFFKYFKVFFIKIILASLVLQILGVQQEEESYELDNVCEWKHL